MKDEAKYAELCVKSPKSGLIYRLLAVQLPKCDYTVSSLHNYL